jgi:heme exporter protein A
MSTGGGEDPFLEARDLTKRFGRFTALAGVDLAVDHGEVLALLGPNGAGKSTLLRLLATLSRPTGGSIRLGGADPTTDPALRGEIGLFGHETMLYDDLTARENLTLHARLHGVPDAAERRERLLERVGLRRRAGERPDRFSHGLRKRLALARALVHDPALLLLDEPHSGLDRRSADRFGDVVEAVTDRTVLLTTHDLSVATRYATRAVFLDRGRRCGTVDLGDVTDPAVLERRYEAAVRGRDEGDLAPATADTDGADR